jgi:ferredoxin
VCPADALAIKERRVYIDYSKCINCGKCIKACPRNLFEIIPVGKNKPFYYVACSSKENALRVKKVCSSGCIGCGICVRLADSPFYLLENISCIDYKKISDQNVVMEEARNKCPTKCIISVKKPS